MRRRREEIRIEWTSTRFDLTTGTGDDMFIGAFSGIDEAREASKKAILGTEDQCIIRERVIKPNRPVETRDVEMVGNW